MLIFNSGHSHIIHSLSLWANLLHCLLLWPDPSFPLPGSGRHSFSPGHLKGKHSSCCSGEGQPSPIFLRLWSPSPTGVLRGCPLLPCGFLFGISAPWGQQPWNVDLWNLPEVISLKQIYLLFSHQAQGVSLIVCGLLPLSILLVTVIRA